MTDNVNSGLRSGLRSGLGSGLVTSSGPSWPVDATRGVGLPTTLAHWNAVLAAAGDASGAPFSAWGMQDASGNLVDAIGTAPLAFTGGGNLYQQSQSGWSQKFVTLTDGTAGRWQSTDSSIADIATTSLLLMLYVNVTATPAGTRSVCELGTTTDARIRENTTPRAIASSGTNLGTAATNNNTGAVRIQWLQVNRTGTAVAAYNDQEIIPAPTFASGMTGVRLVVGGNNSSPCAAAYGLGAAWKAASAEKAKATIKAISQTLGWTIPWS